MTRGLRQRTGFTLIELSIVLVIIGLIVGGVLAGADLINAAKIRATVSQQEKFDAAANTFRNKYNCVPGDCKTATGMGFATNGDGDGQVGVTHLALISGPYVGYQGDGPTWTELGGFWTHLANAKLIDGDYTLLLPSTYPVPGVNTPAARVGNGSGWWVMSDIVVPSQIFWPNGAIAGRHVYWITGQLAHDSPGAATLKPIDAYTIDAKIDDGLPYTGNVRAADNYSSDGGGPSQSFAEGAAGTAACVNNSPTVPIYNFNATEAGSDCANDPTACNRCGLVIGAAF